MARSPYDILGVATDASQDAVRKAYRRLAKKLHPDLNPGDATAEARFKEITQAHQILSDPDRRARLGAAARDFAVRTYDLDTVCLPRHLELLSRVADRRLPSFTSSAVAEGLPGAPPVENGDGAAKGGA